MPGAHDEKLIAEKYSIDYPRRPLATRLWKRRWNWLALFLASLVGFALYSVQGNTAFWSAPVADVHAAFAQDCWKCHTESWQPALRLASLDSGRHSVPNTACQNCHRTVGDHHPRLEEQAPACSSCHQEHRPSIPLIDVADNQCASCHGNMKSVPNAELQFAAEIATFDAGTQGHPEFTFLRGAQLPGKEHGIWQVALPATTNNEKWIDNSGVLFNHKVHLAAEGILDANRQPVQLTCSACHIPEADGRYIQPIVYEQHCASCHPLQLADDLARLGVLPHESPELVRGVIRERVTNLLDEPIAAEPPPAIRRLPQPSILSDPQAQSAEAMLTAANNAVFGLQAKGLCRKCHHVEIRDGEWYVPTLNPKFVATTQVATREMIPSRWFSHGQFHHEKHLTMACLDCHDVAASTMTTDILLAGVATCRKCHGTNPAANMVSVAADCILCHDYHGPAKPLPPSTEAAKLLSFLSAGDSQR